MSKNVLFISEETVKARSNLNSNVDPKLITPAIKYCQDIYVEPVLGTLLFNKIQDEVEAGTLAGNYKTLMDRYITDVLLYYVLSEMPMMLGYKFYNKNVLKKTSESSIEAQSFELDRLAKWYKNKAEYYENRLIKYLVEEDGNSPQIFPEYSRDPGRCDYLQPKKKPYTSSIYLGNSNPKKQSLAQANQGGNNPSSEP